MNRIFSSLILVCVSFFATSRPATAVTIDTVPIGNSGNANDPATGGYYGGVAYTYNMGKYDVTLGQYTAFLNAVAATDTYLLYHPETATDLTIDHISRSGVSGSYSYSVIGSLNNPVRHVSWGDAARFTNWLQNGQPTGAQGPGTTETGAYAMNGITTNEDWINLKRNAGAAWVIPSASEWYKAAYYDPRTTAQGGPPSNSHYWHYATGTNTTPTSAPPGSTPNTANFFGASGYAVTGSKYFSDHTNYLTDVGAYTMSSSPYGTFDQSGNVYQWTEEVIFGSYRGVRGGSFHDDRPINLSAEYKWPFSPQLSYYDVGFRVANVPEPSTLTLAALGALALLIAARRKRHFLWSSLMKQLRMSQSSLNVVCAASLRLLRGMTLAVLAASLLSEAHAVTIVSESGQDAYGFSLTSRQILSASWSETKSFNNVSIQVRLYSHTASTGKAYLTTRIGPGTTIADQVAFATYLFPILNNPTNQIIFSGLTLHPGTYYLTLTGGGGEFDSWYGASSAGSAITKAPGVSWNGTWQSPSPLAFGPASSFILSPLSEQPRVKFQVTGNIVPEPSTLALAALATLGLLIAARR